MYPVLALLFACLWAWSLFTARPLGGFIHVLLVASVVCVSLVCHRGRRAAAHAC